MNETGASVGWRHPGWKTRKTYLGTNKEVFNAKLYPIREALGIVLKSGRAGHRTSRPREVPQWIRVYIWADSQAAIRRLQHNTSGPEQWLARCIMESIRQLGECPTKVDIYWVPDHMHVERNKKANKAAKEAAEKASTIKCPEQLASLTNIECTIWERKSKKVRH